MSVPTVGRLRFVLLLAAVLPLLLPSVAASQEPATPGDPITCQDGTPRRWTRISAPSPPSLMTEPGYIVFDGDANLRVVDNGTDLIQTLSTSGEMLGRFKPPTERPDGYVAISGLASDPDGSLYVGDRDQRRVRKIGPDGALIASWPSHPPGPKTDYGPAGVAASGGIVYAYYSYLEKPPVSRSAGGAEFIQRIERIGPSGEELPAVEAHPAGTVTSMTVDSQGRIYLADWNAHENVVRDDCVIRQLAPDGKVLAVWGEDGTLIERPTVVAVGPDDTVYVVDQEGKRIRSFAPSGDVLNAWRPPAKARGIVVDQDGSLYVTLEGPTPVVRLAPTGEVVRTLGVVTTDPGLLVKLDAIASDPSGNVHALKQGFIDTFSSAGEVLAQRAVPASVAPPAEFEHPSFAVDAAGTLYIKDGAHAVTRVGSDGGTARWEVPTDGGEPGWLVRDLALDAEGNLYVVDGGSVQKLCPDGRRLARWYLRDLPVEGQRIPEGVTVDAAGNVYVVGSFGGLLKLGPDGRMRAHWGADHPANTDVAVDPGGNVYLFNNRWGGTGDPVRMYGPNGDLLAVWKTDDGGYNIGTGYVDSVLIHRAQGHALATGPNDTVFLGNRETIWRLGCPGAA